MSAFADAHDYTPPRLTVHQSFGFLHGLLQRNLGDDGLQLGGIEVACKPTPCLVAQGEGRHDAVDAYKGTPRRMKGATVTGKSMPCAKPHAATTPL